MEIDKEKHAQVKCTECGYKMPIFYTEEANCEGVLIPCKGRHCSNVFELKINNGKQIKD